MKILDHYEGGEWAYFLLCDHFAEDAELFGPQLKDMRRFEILVEVQSEDEVWNVKSAVRAVRKVLSDYLHISLNACVGAAIRGFPHISF
jgi:hypothetical protein